MLNGHIHCTVYKKRKYKKIIETHLYLFNWSSSTPLIAKASPNTLLAIQCWNRVQYDIDDTAITILPLQKNPIGISIG